LLIQQIKHPTKLLFCIDFSSFITVSWTDKQPQIWSLSLQFLIQEIKKSTSAKSGEKGGWIGWSSLVSPKPQRYTSTLNMEAAYLSNVDNTVHNHIVQ
jgi:hypothetical protein